MGNGRLSSKTAVNGIKNNGTQMNADLFFQSALSAFICVLFLVKSITTEKPWPPINRSVDKPLSTSGEDNPPIALACSIG
jgi:hypothetical protein